MHHYSVSEVAGRRVSSDDGVVEYHVQWEGYDSFCDTWEPRQSLLPRCAGAVGEVDVREGTETLRRVESWARGIGRGAHKHVRDETTETQPMPPLYGIVVRSCGGGKGGDVASFVALGERVLTDTISHELNPSKKRKQEAYLGTTAACDPALLLEKCWWDRHAVSFMHDCISAERRTEAVAQFELGAGTDPCRDASNIEIHSIAPAALVKSGQMYGSFTSCEQLIGSEEAGRLRSQCNFSPIVATATQALVRGRRDQLVVRYFLTDATDGTERTLLAMPLSLFRRYYPQLLLSFLLCHVVVIESS